MNYSYEPIISHAFSLFTTESVLTTFFSISEKEVNDQVIQFNDSRTTKARFLIKKKTCLQKLEFFVLSL